MSDGATKGTGSGKRPRNNLVALGTAAVLTVYGAGYLRTRAAAEQFENEGLGRPPVEPAPAVQPTASLLKPQVVRSGAVAEATPSPKVAQEEPTPSAASPEQPSSAATETPSTTDSVAEAVAKYKDGRYTGLGRSRHGNIEATVEIRDGIIVSATITSCRTRYPCSRIDKIIPQVPERQSAWVDNVSSATVSTTAFYYAVLSALKKAE